PQGTSDRSVPREFPMKKEGSAISVMTPYRSALSAGRDGFAQLLHSEWTKFRTVRGWVIGMIVAVLVTAGFGVLGSGTSQSSCQRVGRGGTGPVRPGGACSPSFPPGPGGEPVTDSFYFVHQQLTGDGSITVRLASMTGLLSPPNSPAPNPTQPGLEEWAKA